MPRVGCTEIGCEAGPRQMAVRQKTFGFLSLNPAYGSSLFFAFTVIYSAFPSIDFLWKRIYTKVCFLGVLPLMEPVLEEKES